MCRLWINFHDAQMAAFHRMWGRLSTVFFYIGSAICLGLVCIMISTANFAALGPEAKYVSSLNDPGSTVDLEWEEFKRLTLSDELVRSTYLRSFHPENVISPEQLDRQLQFSHAVYNLTMPRHGRVWTAGDLCMSTELPEILWPGSSLWPWLNDTLLAAGAEPLPAGFGVRRTHCFQYTIFQCFQEGEYVWPTNYKLLRTALAALGDPFPGLIWPGYSGKMSYHDPELNMSAYLTEAFEKTRQGLFGNCSNGFGQPDMSSSVLFPPGTVDDFARVRYVSAGHWFWPASMPELSKRFPNYTRLQLDDVLNDFDRLVLDAWHVLLDSEARNASDPTRRTYFTAQTPTKAAKRAFDESNTLIVAAAVCMGVYFAAYALHLHLRVADLLAWLFGRVAALGWDRYTLVHTQPLLCLLALALLFLSVGASLGLLSLFNVPTTYLNWQTAPLLIVGLGMNDYFVLLGLFRVSDLSVDLATRSKQALQKAGSSVTLSSVCTAAIFALASPFVPRHLQWFCWQMSMATVTNYALTIFVFFPLLMWSSRRMEAGMLEFFPFVSLNEPSAYQLRAVDIQTGIDQSPLVGAARRFYSWYLQSYAARALVVAGVLALLGVSFWLMTGIGYTVPENYSTVEGSPAWQFYRMNERFSNKAVDVLWGTIDYPNLQAEIKDMHAQLARLPRLGFLDTLWLDDLIAWVGSPASGYALDPLTGLVPADDFYPALRDYIATAGTTLEIDVTCHHRQHGQAWAIVPCSTANATIRYSHVYLWIENVSTIEDTIRFVDKNIHDVTLKDRRLGALPVSIWINIADPQDNMAVKAVAALGTCLAGCLVAICVLQASLVSGVLVVVSVFCTTVVTMGAMCLAGISLTSLAFVNLVISMAYSVEFTAHLLKEFEATQGTRLQRTVDAYGALGGASFNGVLSSFLSVVPLAFSKVENQYVYSFEMMSMMLLIELANSLLLLPILLSLFGPNPSALAGKKVADTFEMPSWWV